MTLKIWSKQAAIPTEHGSWVFLRSPLVIGLLLGGQLGLAQVLLVIAALAAFLSRQPLTLLIKILSKRRPSSELAAAIFWLIVFGLIALAAAFGLWRLGAGYLLWLVLPAIPVMSWHLWLVSRRAERRKPGVEILGSAVLAFVAPAGIWLGQGEMSLQGWLIWSLLVLQNAASIVYAYLRLEQRVLAEQPDRAAQLKLGIRALLYTTFNLVLALVLVWLALSPSWLWLAFLVQWAEALYGTFRPALKVKPIKIGIRQMVVSIIFTILFILVWII